MNPFIAFLLLASTSTANAILIRRGLVEERNEPDSLVGGDSSLVSNRNLLKAVGDKPTHHLGGVSLHLRNLKKGRSRKKRNSDSDDNDSCYDDCDPEGVNLEDYPQWQAEEGYWIGEYSFYQSDGTPFTSANWNYPYNAYRGFITGNVKGNAYRQRNVFFYPPQDSQICDRNPAVIGEGACGVNGNTKTFMADQNATTCSTNPELGGDINGPYLGVFDTTTELIGADNALLYQVYLSGSLFQSQLTTLSVDVATNQTRRTRSAQGFRNGLPTYMSFYRERKVDEETFYAEMASTIEEYSILTSDTCTWMDNPSFNPPIITTGLEPGIEGCRSHLEASFAL